LRARDLGEDPSGARLALRNALTVADLCDEYVQNGMNGKKASTAKTDVSRIATHIKPALGKRKVTVVTQTDVETFMRGLSAGSARRVTGLLRAIFSYAVRRKLRPDNPVHEVDKPADQKRLRRLSEGEYAALWASLQQRTNVASEVILFLTISGWRSGEAKISSSRRLI
jgi:site-specific recombinase XerD